MKKTVAAVLMLLLVLALGTVVQAAPADDGLVLYYSFDDESAKDSSSSGFNGTANNVTYAQGVSGKAAVFDAANQSNIVFTMPTGLQDMTLSFWYNISEIPDDDVPYAFICTSAWDNTAIHTHLTDGVVRASYAGFKYKDYKNNELGHTREDSVDWFITDSYVNKWINFTVTYNSATRERMLYMNGTLVAHDVADEDSFGGTTPNFLAGETQIGSWTGDAKRYLTGMMDEIRIYNRALSADEVTELVAVADQYVSVPEPTPTPEATATPTPTQKPTDKPTLEPTSGTTAGQSPSQQATAEVTKSTTGQTGSSSWIIWVVVGVAVVAAAVILFVAKNKKKDQ